MFRRHGKLERRLGRERPRPRDEFVARLAERITSDAIRPHGRWRPVLVGGLTVLLLVAFALTGGIGYAARSVQGGTSAVTSLVTGPANENGNGPSAQSQGGGGPSTQSQGGPSTQPQGGGGGSPAPKITICHFPPGNPDNPQTIEISENAWSAHEEHGDTLGPCEDGGPADDQYADKVLICHIPPGNPENAHTIRVSENAVPAHLAHGDTLGPCPED